MKRKIEFACRDCEIEFEFSLDAPRPDALALLDKAEENFRTCVRCFSVMEMEEYDWSEKWDRRMFQEEKEE